MVGVSTGGASPALAQQLRDDVAALVGQEHAELADRLAALRPWAREALPSYEARRDYFQPARRRGVLMSVAIVGAALATPA